MANFGDPTAGISDPDALNAARMAAMQRALGGVAGPTGPLGPGDTPATSYPSAAFLGGQQMGGVGAVNKFGGNPMPGVDPANNDYGFPSTAPVPQAANANTGPAGVQGDLGPQGPNPIDATNAMNRAAADAQRQGSLGTGAAPAAPPPPAGVTILTPQQAAAGGSLAGGGGGGAPAAATTGGSLGPALTPKAAPAGVTIPTPNAVAAAKAAAPAAGPGAPNPAAAGPGAPPPPAGTANQAGAGTGNLSDLTNSIMSQLQQVQSGLGSTGQSADVSAVYLRQSQSILDMLNQEEATLRADAQKNGTTVDPATQFTISKLQETLDANIKTTKENLNSRGLYDSGIELQLENNLQKGSASDQAMVLNDRLTKLQDQLQAGLTNIGNQRVSTASQFGLAGANAQSTANAASTLADQTRQENAVRDMLSLRGQQSQEQSAAASLAQQNSEFGLSQAQQASQFGASQAQTVAQAQAQRDFEGAQAALARAATAANQQAAEQAAANLAAANRAAASARVTAPVPAQINNPFGGTTKTPGVDAALTNQAIAAVQGAQDRTAALNSLATNQAALAARGVDIQAVQDAIDAQFPESQASIAGNRRVGGPQT